MEKMTIHELYTMLEDLPDETEIRIHDVNSTRKMFDGSCPISEVIICKALPGGADPVVYLSPEPVGVF